jgi:ERAP1-like protein
VIRAFTYVDFLERGRDGRATLQAYMRARLRPAFDRLGWSRRTNESADDRLFRARLIRVLGELGDPEIIAEARRRFAAGEAETQRAELREPVQRIVGRYADRETYDRLLALARRASGTEDRSRLYSALAGALDPALAERTLRLALTDELPSNLASGLIWSVASSGEQAALAWAFAKDNLAALVGRHGATYLDYSMAYLLTNSSRPGDAEELAQFAPLKETAGGRLAVQRATDTILTNAEIAAQQLPAIEDWIRRRASP